MGGRWQGHSIIIVILQGQLLGRVIKQNRRPTNVEAKLARLERGERVDFAKIAPILRA